MTAKANHILSNTPFFLIPTETNTTGAKGQVDEYSRKLLYSVLPT
jgi:hypothetical protein